MSSIAPASQLGVIPVESWSGTFFDILLACLWLFLLHFLLGVVYGIDMLYVQNSSTHLLLM